ncbi:hypothetical protein WJX73_010387 [Symbiochloris irregularis]|uniref:Uncharacterized protein n=1 Tax=Symbiochloris irregularis TaxID=706552 RepID=A0AAW1NNA4_9CHLO
MVKVLYFARGRELAGTQQEEVSLAEGTTVAQLWQILLDPKKRRLEALTSKFAKKGAGGGTSPSSSSKQQNEPKKVNSWPYSKLEADAFPPALIVGDQEKTTNVAEALLRSAQHTGRSAAASSSDFQERALLLEPPAPVKGGRTAQTRRQARLRKVLSCRNIKGQQLDVLQGERPSWATMQRLHETF